MLIILRPGTVLLVHYTHTKLCFDLVTAELPESQENVAPRKIWEVFGGDVFFLVPPGHIPCFQEDPAGHRERGRRDQWILSLLSDLKPGEGGEKGFWLGQLRTPGAAPL